MLIIGLIKKNGYINEISKTEAKGIVIFLKIFKHCCKKNSGVSIKVHLEPHDEKAASAMTENGKEGTKRKFLYIMMSDYDTDDIERIKKAREKKMKKNKLKFEVYYEFNKNAYIYICKVVVGYDCLTNEGQMAALILAIVGVTPQHNAPNRDEYIRVNTENIIPDKAKYFSKQHDCRWLFHKLEYDFNSASHYPYNKYTKNGRATITAANDCNMVFGDASGFSKIDILKIHMLYNYIIWKKENAKRIQACSLLFRPGVNYNAYVPYPFKKREPRRKPNKYLGKEGATFEDDEGKNSGVSIEVHIEPQDGVAASEELSKVIKETPSLKHFKEILESDFDTDEEIQFLKKNKKKNKRKI